MKKVWLCLDGVEREFCFSTVGQFTDSRPAVDEFFYYEGWLLLRIAPGRDVSNNVYNFSLKAYNTFHGSLGARTYWTE